MLASRKIVRGLVRFTGAVVLTVVAALVCDRPIFADSLPAPQGPVILSIDGAVGIGNAPNGADFDLAMLQRLPQKQFVTETPWTKGPHTFTGVALSDLLALVAAKGTVLEASALNEYSAELPVADAKKFGVMVAYLFDGQLMKASDRGPLWIVYPFSQIPETQTETYYIRSIWNLERITMR